jgi:peptide/nickel transport system permease protein
MRTSTRAAGGPDTLGPSGPGPDVRSDAGRVFTDEPTARLRRSFRRRFLSNRWAVLAAVCLTVLIIIALAAPLLAPYAPEAIDVRNRLKAPGGPHLLGTDDLGRDVLSRLLFACRTSLGAATIAVTVGLILGAPPGLFAGYLGGRWDALLSRIADTIMTFPTLILAAAIIAATGPGLRNAMVAIGIVYAPRLFRVVRAAALNVRGETYVEAAVSLGCSTRRILRKHVLPNVLSPLFVQISLMMAFALLAEASLSFLGLGILPPKASWGTMLGRAFRDIQRAPYLIYWPGIAIALTTIAFNTLGDGIRDALGREVRRA